MQYNAMNDLMERVNEPRFVYEMISLYSGMNVEMLQSDIEEKKIILQWIVQNKINDVNQIGIIMSEYYSNKEKLLSRVR